MSNIILYASLHHPLYLSPESEQQSWDEQTAKSFRQYSKDYYFPFLEKTKEQLELHPDFKLLLGISGQFIDFSEKYVPELITLIEQIVKRGIVTGQIELANLPYYHSISSLFPDPHKHEFKEQIALHRLKLKEMFGVRPVTFANSELIYNNNIGNISAALGYQYIIAHHPYLDCSDNCKTPQFFRIKKSDDAKELVILPWDYQTSIRLLTHSEDELPFDYSYLLPHPNSVKVMAIDVRGMGMSGHFSHTLNLWSELPNKILHELKSSFLLPSSFKDHFDISSLPILDLGSSEDFWESVQLDSGMLLVNKTQNALLHKLDALMHEAHKSGEALLSRWRKLSAIEHFIHLRGSNDPAITRTLLSNYKRPYESTSMATYILTESITSLVGKIQNFNVLKKTEKTPIIIISPETARLPTETMGAFAKFISGKSGGMGEVISALCKGLTERNIETHLITLDLGRRFREEAKLNEEEWNTMRHRLSSEHIHLISSSAFDNMKGAYDENPAWTAAEFQSQIVNHALKNIISRYRGKAIIHTHDWMAGGVVTAYAKQLKIPLLHTIHNTHTADIPYPHYHSVNLHKLQHNLYNSHAFNQTCIDSQATAIKNSTRLSVVGKRFLEEIVNDYFSDRHFIAWSVRQEIKVKYYANEALVVPNGISPDMYPENQKENPDLDSPGLALKFKPGSDLITAKKTNLLKFQHQMKLQKNPNAILLFWPSRLDPIQKGIDLLEDVALKFVIAHHDVQIAVVGDPVGKDHYHREVMGRIACTSNGKIAYAPFNEDLCMLGYAAASDVFGASLYEPFGQIDVLGNLYGATATNRDTGGYHDKIRALSLKARGAPTDIGNGVLFKDYDSGGLWWGLRLTVENHRFLRNNPHIWEIQMKRIMDEARQKWSLENMIASYISTYMDLNGGKYLL